MVSGRLREHDRNQIALDLIEWAQLDTSTTMLGFCAGKLISPNKITDWAREDEFFRVAYDIAKACVGERREKKLSDGKLHVKAYDLNAAVYDRFLKEERQEMAKFEALLKFVEEQNQNPEVIEKFDALMDLMKKAQERKIEEINKSVDNKS